MTHYIIVFGQTIVVSDLGLTPVFACERDAQTFVRRRLNKRFRVVPIQDEHLAKLRVKNDVFQADYRGNAKGERQTYEVAMSEAVELA